MTVDTIPVPRWHAPSLALWALVLVLASVIGPSVYTIPVQHPDSFEAIARGVEAPSSRALFVWSLEVSKTTLRPLRYLQARWLVQLAEATGTSYTAVFRGVHALVAVGILLLFRAALRVTAWPEVCAGSAALVVLAGHHAFDATLRDAYPVNHYAVVSLALVAVVAVSVGRRHPWRELALVALLLYVLLLLESGVLVGVAMIGAGVLGLPGISRKLAVTSAVVLMSYLAFRAALGIVTPGVGGNGSGFLGAYLSAEELGSWQGWARIGFMLYNVVGALLSAVLSEPRFGRYATIAVAQGERLEPVLVTHLVSSAIITSVLLWYAVSRLPRRFGAWNDRDRLFALACLLIVTNAALATAYIKDEILAAAGVGYALAAYVALAALLSLRPPVRLAIAVSLLLAASMGGWAFRAAGVPYHLRVAAFKSRGDWARARLPSQEGRGAGRVAVLERRLRDEAIARPTIATEFLPHWAESYWGE